MVKIIYEDEENGFTKVHEGNFAFGAIITEGKDGYKTRVFTGGEMDYDDLPEILASMAVNILGHIEGDGMESAQRITQFGILANEKVGSWIKEHKDDILQGINDFISQMK